jgi:hypothetical protein
LLCRRRDSGGSRALSDSLSCSRVGGTARPFASSAQPHRRLAADADSHSFERRVHKHDSGDVHGISSLSFANRSLTSRFNCANVRGLGPGSLQAYPRRSYVQTLVKRQTRDCTRNQSKEKSPNPFSTITVGVPSPAQRIYWGPLRCDRYAPRGDAQQDPFHGTFDAPSGGRLVCYTDSFKCQCGPIITIITPCRDGSVSERNLNAYGKRRPPRNTAGGRFYWYSRWTWTLGN